MPKLVGGGPQPRNTLHGNSHTTVIGRPPSITYGLPKGQKRALETRSVVGNNVLPELEQLWDLHGKDYDRPPAKKSKHDDPHSPEQSVNSTSPTKDNDRRKSHSSVFPQGSQTSIASSIRSQGSAKQESCRNPSSQTGVAAYKKVERLMNGAGSGYPRTRRSMGQGSSLESTGKTVLEPPSPSAQPPPVIDVDKTLEPPEKAAYRGTANCRPPQIKQRRSSAHMISVSGGIRAFRRKSDYSNHLPKDGPVRTNGDDKPTRPAEEVVEVEPVPASFHEINTPTQISRPIRTSPRAAVKSVGETQAGSDSPVEVESPDPIQEGMPSLPQTRLATRPAEVSTHRKAVAHRRASSATKLPGSRFGKRPGESPGDIKATHFVHTGRDQTGLFASSRNRTGSRPVDHSVCLIKLIRNASTVHDMPGLTLDFRARASRFLPSLDGLDLSESAPDLAFEAKDIWATQWDKDVLKMQICRRGTFQDIKVDLEFLSVDDFEAAFNLLSELEVKLLKKTSKYMDDTFLKRSAMTRQYDKTEDSPIIAADEKTREVNLLEHREELHGSRRTTIGPDHGSTKKGPRQESPPRRTRSSVIDLKPVLRNDASSRKSTATNGRRSSDSFKPLRMSIDVPVETRSRSRLEARVNPRRKSRQSTPTPPTPLERYSVRFGLGTAWDGPVVYPFDGERSKQTTVEQQDVERLDEGEYLNDSLIQFYLRCLEHALEQSRPDLARRIYTFNTHFYFSLTTTENGKRGINYEKVKRWTSKVNLFDYDYVVVPINEMSHWYVAIICNLSGHAKRSTKKASSAAAKDVTEVYDEEINDQPDRTMDSTTLINDEEVNETKSKPDVDIVSTEKGVSRMSISQESATNQTGSRPTSRHGEEGGDTSMELHLGDGEVDAIGEEWPPEDENGEAPIRIVSTPGKPSQHRIFTKSPTYGKQGSKPITVESPGMTDSPIARKGKRKSIPGLKKYNSDETIIITLDSLGSKHPITTRNLKEYLHEEGRAKHHLDIDIGTIQGMTASGIPLQDNYWDCGLFLLGYMEKFFQDPKVFVMKILQREMDAKKDWPDMDPSQMRQTMREMLLALGQTQTQTRVQMRKDAKRQAALKEGKHRGSKKLVEGEGEHGSPEGREKRKALTSEDQADTTTPTKGIASDAIDVDGKDTIEPSKPTTPTAAKSTITPDTPPEPDADQEDSLVIIGSNSVARSNNRTPTSASASKKRPTPKSRSSTTFATAAVPSSSTLEGPATPPESSRPQQTSRDWTPTAQLFSTSPGYTRRDNSEIVIQDSFETEDAA